MILFGVKSSLIASWTADNVLWTLTNVSLKDPKGSDKDKT